MGILKKSCPKEKLIEDKFENFFDLGWRFIPQRNKLINKKSKITDYEVRAPSGRIYSLCDPINFFKIEPYLNEDFNTEFDYEISQYNLQSEKINKERKSLLEIINLIDPLDFKERLRLYHKFEKRVD